MTEIGYKLYGDEAQIVSYSTDCADGLCLKFENCAEGFVSINGIATRVREGTALPDVRFIDEGEHAPVLIMKFGRIVLPRIKKRGSEITLSYCDEEYVRSVSMRERMLCERVRELETAVDALNKSVYGTTIM